MCNGEASEAGIDEGDAKKHAEEVLNFPPLYQLH
jgi:hypothetical protein